MENLTAEEREFLKSHLEWQINSNESALKLNCKPKSKHSVKLIELTEYERESLRLKISSFKKIIKAI